MSTEHGITLDEQIRWLSDESAFALQRAKQYDEAHENEPGGYMHPPDYWSGVAAKYRAHAGFLMAIENSLRAAQVSVVSPPPARMAGSPLGPSGPGGFYPGD